MNTDQLKTLADLLKQFRAEQDADGAKSIAAAKDPQSAANRERVIRHQLGQIDFVSRWVDAKLRALNTPPPQTDENKDNHKNDQR